MYYEQHAVISPFSLINLRSINFLSWYVIVNSIILLIMVLES